MNTQFRKKPVVIEAVQWLPGRVVAGVVGDKADSMCGCALLGGDGSSPHVHTANGAVRVNAGDWICTQIIDGRRDIWPCRDEVFRETYEPASSSVSVPSGESQTPTGDALRMAVAKLIGRLDLDGVIPKHRMDDALGLSEWPCVTDTGDAIQGAMKAAGLTARRDNRGYLEFLNSSVSGSERPTPQPAVSEEAQKPASVRPNPLTVACDYCEADIGEACHDLHGGLGRRQLAFHSTREGAARRALDDAAVRSPEVPSV